MSSLAEHPTVKRFHELNDAAIARSRIQGKDQISEKLEAEWLRQLCLEAGANEVGFVDLDRRELGRRRDEHRRHE